jgi:hypothetical protein
MVFGGGVMWKKRRGRDQERRKGFMQEVARSQAATESMCRQELVIVWLVKEGRHVKSNSDGSH